MKRYKKDNFDFLLGTKEEFAETKYYEEINDLFKDNYRLMIILKNKKLVGYLGIDISSLFNFTYTIFIYRVKNYKLNIKSQKDLFIILEKLNNIGVDIDDINLKNNKNYEKFKERKKEIKWKKLFSDLKKIKPSYYIDAHELEDEIYKRFILDIINKKFTDKNEIIKYAKKIDKEAIKLDYNRWFS